MVVRICCFSLSCDRKVNISRFPIVGHLKVPTWASENCEYDSYSEKIFVRWTDNCNNFSLANLLCEVLKWLCLR